MLLLHAKRLKSRQVRVVLSIWSSPGVPRAENGTGTRCPRTMADWWKLSSKLSEGFGDRSSCTDSFFDLVVCFHKSWHQSDNLIDEIAGDDHDTFLRIAEHNVSLKKVSAWINLFKNRRDAQVLSQCCRLSPGHSLRTPLTLPRCLRLTATSPRSTRTSAQKTRECMEPLRTGLEVVKTIEKQTVRLF